MTGTLEQAGVFLGEVLTKATYNEKGNRANPKITALNEKVLKTGGGEGWSAPPATVVWTDELRAERDQIISAYEGQPIWGFKDPRTLLTLEGWMEALPMTEFVGIFRHPVAVANSLLNRTSLRKIDDFDHGIRLWTIYNQKLLERHAKYKFPMISFDSDTATFVARVRALIAKLGLVPPPEEGLFFEDSLRKQKAGTDVQLPPVVSRIYEELNAIAQNSAF